MLVSPLMFVQGATEGPRLVVTGPREVIEPLANHLWDMPQLPAINGTLILRDGSQSPHVDRPDNVLKLKRDSRNDYRRILKRMIALSMISDPAVPQPSVA